MCSNVMCKLTILGLAIAVVGFTSSCAILKPFGIGKGENGGEQEIAQTYNGEAQQGVQAVPVRPGEQKYGSQPAGQPQAQTPAGQQPTRSGLVTQRAAPQGSVDRQIMELKFEMKKLQSEIAHLNTEITNLGNRSEMWRNPQAVYNKRVILTNGTTFNGNVVYQDERIVKVETLIGSLVLQRNSISRILENTIDIISEEAAQEGIPLSRRPGVIRETSAGYTPSATTAIRRANVVLDGTIKEKKDKSGNTIFVGVLKNTGNRRADFVKINFVIRKDWSGTTQTFTTFVDGAQYTYGSGVTTDTTMPPGASGTFELYVPRAVGDFFGYSYSIDWEEYE